jgi:hypothetical protein
MNATTPSPSDDGRKAPDAPGGGPAAGAGGGPAAGEHAERVRRPSPPPDDDASAHHPAPVDLSSESVAGEEDPGAGLDMAIEPDEPPGKARTQDERDRTS